LKEKIMSKYFFGHSPRLDAREVPYILGFYEILNFCPQSRWLLFWYTRRGD
jgi:hypothetical protein